jgi:hypothetical protein
MATVLETAVAHPPLMARSLILKRRTSRAVGIIPSAVTGTLSDITMRIGWRICVPFAVAQLRLNSTPKLARMILNPQTSQNTDVT